MPETPKQVMPELELDAPIGMAHVMKSLSMTIAERLETNDRARKIVESWGEEAVRKYDGRVTWYQIFEAEERRKRITTDRRK